MQYTPTSERNPSIENDSPEDGGSMFGDVVPPNERLSEDFLGCSSLLGANIADIRSDKVPELDRFQSKRITDHHHHPDYFAYSLRRYRGSESFQPLKTRRQRVLSSAHVQPYSGARYNRDSLVEGLGRDLLNYQHGNEVQRRFAYFLEPFVKEKDNESE